MVILMSTEGLIEKCICVTFQATNNVVVYEALLPELRQLRLLKAKKVLLHNDLRPIVNQVNNIFETKEERMEKHLEETKIEISTFEEFEIKPVPRRNIHIDSLASLALEVNTELKKSDPCILSIKSKHSIKRQDFSFAQTYHRYNKIFVVDTLLKVSHSRDPHNEWRRYGDNYQKVQELHSYLGNPLSKHYAGCWLKCFPDQEAQLVLRELYEGQYSTHLGRSTLSQRIIRQGYYLDTVGLILIVLVQKKLPFIISLSGQKMNYWQGYRKAMYKSSFGAT